MPESKRKIGGLLPGSGLELPASSIIENQRQVNKDNEMQICLFLIKNTAPLL
jgi:hypothetical protein